MSKESIKEFIEFAIKFNVWKFNLRNCDKIVITETTKKYGFTLNWFNDLTEDSKESYTIIKDWVIQRTK